jgi:predicted permease
MAGSSIDENLFPAIGQVFVIIGLGYLCGRFKILRPEDSKSLSWFAGTIALPALLFESMANINFSAINWAFMGGIVISKCLVFLLVATVTFLVKRPWHPGYAGLYAVFSTDANDLALGLPLMTALYSVEVDGHLVPKIGPNGFNYISYMYLVAPIALLLLNPIGFVLIELGNRIEEYKTNKSEEKKIVIFARIMLKTIKGIVKSPVVFMTVLGVIVNMIIVYGIKKGVRDTEDNLPMWLSAFLELLGGGFAPLALFRLGNILVGKLKLLSGSVLIVDLLLIIAKSLLLAFLILLFLSLFGLPEELISFGFLYGTFPTTPSVFVYATTYKIGVDVISTSMVLGTFISAPLMYATARVTLIESVNETQYHEVIYYTELDVSALSLVGAILVVIIFLLAKRYKSLVYVMILHLMTAQILTNVGAIGTFAITTSESWKLFFFTIYEGSYLAMKMWSASLALTYFVKLKWGERKAEWLWIPLLAASWM